MSKEKYELEIRIIIEQNRHLNLTSEQAAQIWHFEREGSEGSTRHTFSDWEAFDYELYTYRQILNPDQIRIYEEYQSENIRRIELDMQESDKHHQNEIDCYKEMLSYYKDQFLPGLNKLLASRRLGSTLLTPKIDLLKSEYRLFLNDYKKDILINHFRYCRMFKPNELEVSLLKHQLFTTWPSYSLFKQSADESVKAVMTYVEDHIGTLPEKEEEIILKRIAEKNAFCDSTLLKCYEGPGKLYIVHSELSPIEEKKHLYMTLIILDKPGMAFP